ncbi:MAG: DNA-deoxyinosine glycosylase [Lachnospiraceae bacterium]|nr:DNA-deoxyinosine glycosylase [Lachnospiraceae bacterium]
MKAVHEFNPVYNNESRILILGSFPSVKSREQKFYYGHPANRFWKVLAQVREEEIPKTVEEKTAFLLRNRIAVWDVIAECDIEGSSDSSIRNAVPTDVEKILREAPIQAVFCNGRLSETLFHRYHTVSEEISVTGLPSTSPANAAWSMEKLYKKWVVINSYLPKK